MSILADTGYVYALYYPDDAHHQQALAFANVNTEPIMLPAVWSIVASWRWRSACKS